MSKKNKIILIKTLIVLIAAVLIFAIVSSLTKLFDSSVSIPGFSNQPEQLPDWPQDEEVTKAQEAEEKRAMEVDELRARIDAIILANPAATPENSDELRSIQDELNQLYDN